MLIGKWVPGRHDPDYRPVDVVFYRVGRVLLP